LVDIKGVLAPDFAADTPQIAEFGPPSAKCGDIE
jgi:hypothetical protein